MKYALGFAIVLSFAPVYAESAAAQKVAGWLDIADCSGISGWAWDASQPSQRLSLDLYDGSVQGSPLATAEASNLRPDLKRLGMGDGAYGFYVATPAALKDGRTHAIVAAVSGTTTQIETGVNTLACPADARGYNYYFTDTLSAMKQESWASRGDTNVTPDGFTSASASGAALISRVAVPDATSDYEVRAFLNLKQSGGVYTIYLHASPDALAGADSGSYYAVELQNPTFTEQACTATLAISKRSSDSVTSLLSRDVACQQGMELRAVAAENGRIGVWVDHRNLAIVEDSEVAGGQPGLGVRNAPASNALTAVQLGTLDRLAPGPLQPSDVKVATSANSVELSWPRITDDPNGTGIGVYEVSRDGKVIAHVSRVNPTFTDKEVAPGGEYTYEISAYDMHLNRTSTFVTVAMPDDKLARR